MENLTTLTKPINQMTEMEWEEHMIEAGRARFLNEQRKGIQKIMPDGRKVEVADEGNTIYGNRLIDKNVRLMADYMSNMKEQYKKQSGFPPYIIALMDSIDVHVICYSAIRAIVDRISKENKLTALGIAISRLLEDQVRLAIFKETAQGHYKTLEADLKRRRVTDYKHKRKVMLDGMNKNKEVPQWVPWDINTCVQVGISLIEICIAATSDYEAGRRQTYTGLIEKDMVFVNGKGTAVVRGTAKTLEFILDCLEHGETAHPVNLPCLIRPLDWTTSFDGGYHHPVMREANGLIHCTNGTGRQFVKHVLPLYDIQQELDAINSLQSVKYRINKAVFAQLQRERKREDGIKLPPKEELTVPPCPLAPIYPEDYPTTKMYQEAKQNQKESLTTEEKQVFGKWCDESREAYTLEEQRKGTWIGILQTYNVARMLVDVSWFYFTYFMDWRGRKYPMCTALSPQSNKFAKALLEFVDYCPVGQSRDFLSYIAGLWGKDSVDKLSLKDQEAYVLTLGDKMFEVQQDTDATRDWWAQAKDPWGFLAACVHFGHVVKGIKDGLDVSSWETNGICFADGRCNGLQHFSMILKDEEGAESVNLIPLDKPNDIYSKSLDILLDKVQRIIAGENDSDVTEQLAYELMESGILTRDLTKNPTMTFCYGGTVEGTRAWLKDYLLSNWTGPTPARDVTPLLTKLVWDSVNSAIDKTKEGMQYLRKLAWEASKGNTPIVWTTPTGMPICQWYSNEKVARVHVNLVGIKKFAARVRSELTECDHYKMRNSFPPNYVHSMDAAHLTLAVNRAVNSGITSVCTVHDSFGCHAGQLKEFKQHIRDCFADMYSTDRLAILWGQLQEQCGIDAETILPYPEDVCKYGNFDVNKVRDAEFAFL